MFVGIIRRLPTTWILIPSSTVNNRLSFVQLILSKLQSIVASNHVHTYRYYKKLLDVNSKILHIDLHVVSTSISSLNVTSASLRYIGRHREARDAIKRKREIHEEWRYSITPKTTAWESGVRNNTKQTASGGGY